MLHALSSSCPSPTAAGMKDPLACPETGLVTSRCAACEVPNATCTSWDQEVPFSDRCGNEGPTCLP
eukprot:1160336-Pelagomonas_calceolata.AAC.7